MRDVIFPQASHPTIDPKNPMPKKLSKQINLQLAGVAARFEFVGDAVNCIKGLEYSKTRPAYPVWIFIDPAYLGDLQERLSTALLDQGVDWKTWEPFKIGHTPFHFCENGDVFIGAEKFSAGDFEKIIQRRSEALGGNPS